MSEIRIDDDYSSNKSITIYETETIIKEIEIVMQIRDWQGNDGEAKFRFNNKAKIDAVINALTKMRDERWS